MENKETKNKGVNSTKSVIEEIRKHIITEHDLQNTEVIEFSYSGDLVPFEIVEHELNKLGRLCCP